jgi:hypothetical protein
MYRRDILLTLFLAQPVQSLSPQPEAGGDKKRIDGRISIDNVTKVDVREN